MIRTKVLFVACFVAGATPLQAHEGHSHTPAGQGETAAHYLSSTFHLAQFALLAAIVFTVGLLAIRVIQRRAAIQAKNQIHT